jgi:nitrile hydratase subunit beta
MRLQHTLGGLEGLGPVTFEKRVFVEPWEKRIFGIHVAMMALSSQLPLAATPSKFNTVWTWADLRKGAESLNPFDYFKYRYYEKWLGGISGYFVDKGYITEAELAARTEQILRNSASASANGGDPAIDRA